MRLALNEARKAPHHQWKIGAVLVRGGSLISSGQNKYRNSPTIVDFEGVSYHAEQIALRRAQETDGATMYVARVTKSGGIGNARPCPRCQALMRDAGVHTVVWSTPTGIEWCRLAALVAA
jgi:tRNA(Arg) A34 adenosine deaminase TadA